MALFSYQRLAYLFDIIKNETLPQSELATRLLVSTRTIRTDVIALNETLSDFGARVDYKKNIGYQLIIFDPKLYDQLPQKQQQNRIPRNNHERILSLIISLLTQQEAIKIDEIANRWFVSRDTIQSDLVDVKERLLKYQLTIQTKPQVGLQIIGNEIAIRACLTDLLWNLYTVGEHRAMIQIQETLLANIDLNYLDEMLQTQFERFDLTINTEGKGYLLYSCAITIARITGGKELIEYEIEKVAPNIYTAAFTIAEGMSSFLGTMPSLAELNYLAIQIASRSLREASSVSEGLQDKSDQLIHHILNNINERYHYDLRNDVVLKQDLSAHISSMLTRVKYGIHSSNPLLKEIQQHYPFAYDITVSALTNTEHITQAKLKEDEVCFIAAHLGVALERNYGGKHKKQTQILLVSELGNATLKMIESKIKQHFPQVKMTQILSYREYEALNYIEEDFVITTTRLVEKDKPILKITPFPTLYQLEQLGRLVMMDRNKPIILAKFFHEDFFMIVEERITQDELFQKVCHKLENNGYVTDEFYFSLVERESITSTYLGENIAIPHSIGLLATKTIVTTVLAPKGISWNQQGDEESNVIFLLAISKDEYEEAMTIYDLFVQLVKERATKRLLNSKSFEEFSVIVRDCFTRI